MLFAKWQPFFITTFSGEMIYSNRQVLGPGHVCWYVGQGTTWYICRVNPWAKWVHMKPIIWGSLGLKLTIFGVNFIKAPEICMFILHHSLLLKNSTGCGNSLLWKRKAHLCYSQYHVSWWPGNARSQGISRHGIDLAGPDYPVAAWVLLIQPNLCAVASCVVFALFVVYYICYCSVVCCALYILL